MNDLIPTSDFAVISLVPILLASAVFIAGGFLATRLKGFIGAGGILKKANAPETSVPRPRGPKTVPKRWMKASLRQELMMRAKRIIMNRRR